MTFSRGTNYADTANAVADAMETLRDAEKRHHRAALLLQKQNEERLVEQQRRRDSECNTRRAAAASEGSLDTKTLLAALESDVGQACAAADNLETVVNRLHAMSKEQLCEAELLSAKIDETKTAAVAAHEALRSLRSAHVAKSRSVRMKCDALDREIALLIEQNSFLAVQYASQRKRPSATTGSASSRASDVVSCNGYILKKEVTPEAPRRNEPSDALDPLLEPNQRASQP